MFIMQYPIVDIFPSYRLTFRGGTDLPNWGMPRYPAIGGLFSYQVALQSVFRRRLNEVIELYLYKKHGEKGIGQRWEECLVFTFVSFHFDLSVTSRLKMLFTRPSLCLLGVTASVGAQGTYSYEAPTTFGLNGFASWGAANFPPSTVGLPLVPQSTDSQTLSLLTQLDPSRIQNYIQTLVNFGTCHTASTTTSPARGIGAARKWLLKEMQELAKPSNGAMKVSMPCYLQPAQPRSGMPIAAQVCNVQVEIKGTVDPNRTYVYTGHYDSRRLNNSNNVDDAPGADDNASAVAVALEMIRILAPVMAKTPPPTTIIIAAVAGEE
jgi:hypothetical protein